MGQGRKEGGVDMVFVRRLEKDFVTSHSFPKDQKRALTGVYSSKMSPISLMLTPSYTPGRGAKGRWVSAGCVELMRASVCLQASR